MATYVSLVGYTEMGITKIKDSPKRLEKVRKLAKKLGGELKQFYLCLGAYDIVAVYEMPDNMKAATFALKLGSMGAVRTTTMVAFGEKDYRKIIKALPA
ncbi:MAG: GYD domain-containing protein [Rhodospirillales bacterium]|nr:GYD domain-containing protein [Rhodospirillales bacterium]